MGLLDDAIREHLELKRRHGADPSEVARQEQEALGPARRGPEPLEVAPQGEAAAPAPADAAAEEAADPALIDPQVDAPVYREPDEHRGAIAMSEAEPVPPDEAPEATVPEPAAEAPAPPVTPERSEAAPPPDEADLDWEAPEDDASAGQPTVAFDAAEVEEAQRRTAPEPRRDEPTGGEDDVLEETPDFLQETPEHDRLWFEQRPPRDFDFDG